MVLLYLINFADLITNFEKVLNKITNEISDKIEKYSTKDFKIAIVVISVSKTLNIVGIYFSGYKFSKTIRQIVAIKSVIDVLNLSTSS
jgi:F420-0:gamma-glutamyl ligase-like protein